MDNNEMMARKRKIENKNDILVIDLTESSDEEIPSKQYCMEENYSDAGFVNETKLEFCINHVGNQNKSVKKCSSKNDLETNATIQCNAIQFATSCNRTKLKDSNFHVGNISGFKIKPIKEEKRIKAGPNDSVENRFSWFKRKYFCQDSKRNATSDMSKLIKNGKYATERVRNATDDVSYLTKNFASTKNLENEKTDVPWKKIKKMKDYGSRRLFRNSIITASENRKKSPKPASTLSSLTDLFPSKSVKVSHPKKTRDFSLATLKYFNVNGYLTKKDINECLHYLKTNFSEIQDIAD